MREKIPEDPFQLFDEWFTQAKEKEINDPNAMALAVIDNEGRPSARIVLLKDHDKNGFTFFTNYESRKGAGLIQNPQAELCFYWKSLRKQIRITGNTQKVSNGISDEYYNSRARTSRIGAWASQQTRPLENYEQLEQRVKEMEEKFKGQEAIPRPPYWGGFQLIPQRMEFWEEQPHRLHKRFVYLKNGENWDTQWLYP